MTSCSSCYSSGWSLSLQCSYCSRCSVNLHLSNTLFNWRYHFLDRYPKIMTDEGIRVVRQWLGASSPLEEGTWHSKTCYRKSLLTPFKHLKTIIHISSSWWFPWTDLVFWLLNKWFRLCCSGWKSSQHRSFASGYYSRPCWKIYPKVQSYSAQPRVCKTDDHAPVCISPSEFVQCRKSLFWLWGHLN